MVLRWRGLWLLLAAACLLPARQAAADALMNSPQLRRPAALVAAADGRWLFVANERSGSLSVIDIAARQVAGETAIGRRLSDLAALPDGRTLLATDQEAGELLVLATRGAAVQVVSRVAVSRAPVGVLVLDGGRGCSVTSLWSRRVTIVDLSDPAQPQARHVVDLPFAPRRQCLLKENLLLVADSFGGHLAVVDAAAGRLLRKLELFAHNIRGLALSADGREVLLAHQMLHREGYTTHDGVHWGGVMSNVVRSLPVDAVLGNKEMPARDVFFLGTPDNATGDPDALAVTPDGRQILAFAGISEIGVSDVGANYYASVGVGRRPRAVALGRDNRLVFVANAFSDSISLVELDPPRQVAEISLGPTAPLTRADRGELLFYDARLSSDGWFSCHSCHTDGHTNGLLSDNLSDGSFGAAKRVLSLLGVADTGPWAWDGQVASLDEQILKSITTTMRGPQPSATQVRQLSAYLSTLRPPPALHAARETTGRAAQIERGRQVFQLRGCADCHQGDDYTSGDAYDVGYADEVGNRLFNPPSLRGVSQRDRLFHDNRASDLRDAFERLRHGCQQQPLSPANVADLVSYLESL